MTQNWRESATFDYFLASARAFTRFHTASVEGSHHLVYFPSTLAHKNAGLVMLNPAGWVLFG